MYQLRYQKTDSSYDDLNEDRGFGRFPLVTRLFALFQALFQLIVVMKLRSLFVFAEE